MSINISARGFWLFPTFYGIRIFIIISYKSPSFDHVLNQLNTINPLFKTHFNIILPATPNLHNDIFCRMFSTKFFYLFLISYIYSACPHSLVWSVNSCWRVKLVKIFIEKCFSVPIFCHALSIYSHLICTMRGQYKAWTVFARSNARIVGSNPTQGVDVCIVCVYSVFLLFCV
jgi:hypothetical protein